MGEMNMIYFLTAVIIILLAVLAVVYIRTSRLLTRLDDMIESAIKGSFAESEYSEKRLSRLESKMYRYLNAGKTAQRQITSEKDNIKTLVSDISHQTNTPVSNILLYTQLLGEAPELNDDTKQLACQIEQQTEKLSFLIASLVKTSRLENGILTVQPKEESVGKLLDALDFTSQAQEKNIDLSIGKADGMIACFDLKWTLESLSNILDNAIKYTPEGGKVNVSAREYEMFIRIDVADSGIGMNEEETAQVFARFYRSPRVSQEKGVGIGLYLAREILSREGGYIKVSSVINQGSTFSIFLPKTNANLSKL